MDGAIPWMESVVAGLQTDPIAATRALEDFEKEPHALDAAQAILAGSQNPHAQFFAVSTLQKAGLSRWAGLSNAARRHLISICWDRILHQHQEFFVRNALLQACAVFWKRGWAAGAGGGALGAADADAPDSWSEQTKAELLGGLATLINTGGGAHVVEVSVGP